MKSDDKPWDTWRACIEETSDRRGNNTDERSTAMHGFAIHELPAVAFLKPSRLRDQAIHPAHLLARGTGYNRGMVLVQWKKRMESFHWLWRSKRAVKRNKQMKNPLKNMKNSKQLMVSYLFACKYTTAGYQYDHLSAGIGE